MTVACTFNEASVQVTPEEPIAKNIRLNGFANGHVNGHRAAADGLKEATVGPEEPVPDGEKIHVLIIGAGLTGLLLAQGLRKLNATLELQGHLARYTFTLYERDEAAFYRGGGFSLTVHWALQQLYDILPQELSDRIFHCVGNPAAIENGQMGSFTYLNLRTGHPQHHTAVPAGWKGARMSRVKFLKMLMTGLTVQYSKRLAEISFPDAKTVSARFEDNEIATGHLLIGADGSRSVVRKYVYGTENSKNIQLPIRMINCRCEYPIEEMKGCLNIDPHLFHGGDPVQNGYFMFAFLDVPPPGSDQTVASVQLTISWPYKPGFLGEENPEPPREHVERIAWLRRLTEHWASPVYDLLQPIPVDSISRPVTIEEWLPDDQIRRPTDGRVTVVGDAAHLMTSCKIGTLSACNLGSC